MSLAAATEAAVTDVLGGSGWTSSPLGGSTGRTWRAIGSQAVVVRWDADVRVLTRTAEIGVGPRVLGAGQRGGRTFVIQEDVAHAAASAGSIEANAPDVARLVARFAADPGLTTLARPLPAGPYAADLLQRTRLVSSPRVHLAEQLVDRAGRLGPAPLVASHGDPNSENLLFAERLLLVDWDDLRRADTMRDLGQLAWWYLPEDGWPAFLEDAGQPLDRAAIRRLYWWVAAESLDVALRLLPAEPAAAEGFFLDFEAASEGRPNPRRPAR